MNDISTTGLIAAERKVNVDAVDDGIKILVENLDLFYSGKQALFDINMAFPEKRVTAMIGPSGCGKSTFLRVINRMFDLYPGQKATGRVMMDNQNIVEPQVRAAIVRSRIGMVFQKPTPFPMSIHDNIAYGIKLNERVSRAEINERIEWALTKAALWGEVKDRLHTSAIGLSGGQ